MPKKVRRTVTIRPDQGEWVNNSPINFSALVRQAIDEYRDDDFEADSETVVENTTELFAVRCVECSEVLGEYERLDDRGAIVGGGHTLE